MRQLKAFLAQRAEKKRSQSDAADQKAADAVAIEETLKFLRQIEATKGKMIFNQHLLRLYEALVLSNEMNISPKDQLTALQRLHTNIPINEFVALQSYIQVFLLNIAHQTPEDDTLAITVFQIKPLLEQQLDQNDFFALLNLYLETRDKFYELLDLTGQNPVNHDNLKIFFEMLDIPFSVFAIPVNAEPAAAAAVASAAVSDSDSDDALVMEEEPLLRPRETRTLPQAATAAASAPAARQGFFAGTRFEDDDAIEMTPMAMDVAAAAGK